MSGSAADLSYRLAQHAEAVCRAYLCHGRREGNWWTVGDVFNTPGRSLYVRLHGERAGHWTDSATGEYGDLLDLIALNLVLNGLRDTLAEARSFLSVPRPVFAVLPVPSGSSEAARRLFRAGRSILGTPAEAYLRARGLLGPLDWSCLRFHPSVWCRGPASASRQSWPALLAAVTDERGVITGIQRTYLDRLRAEKAPLDDPRRSLGNLLGNGVRFGVATEVLAAGEGIETVLALKSVLPDLPMVAALSANHLAALTLAPPLVRLYVARDNDSAGYRAVERLRERGQAVGIAVHPLVPWAEDFNADLLRFGPAALRGRLADQLVSADAVRFLPHRQLA